ncbi:hypothetical protein [Kitasatospora sp. NPDC001547]|uniref:WXG100-like domain-containing protein n=1 Tax=Kitasatospora sp. NPDC001547 TaxID=3364015 RepID=UPI0036D1DA4C
MSIMLPPGLAKFFSIVTGMKWPEADEDRLRAAGDDYLAIHAEIPELREWLRRLLATVHDNDDFAGEAADRFYQRVLPLIGGTGGTDYVTAAGLMAKQLGDFAHKVANQVEYAKWMIIAQLIQLVAQIAWAIAMSPITFGGSLAEIFVAYETAGAVIKQVFIWLFKQLLLHEFLSITTAMVMDGIIQGIQIGKGHKDEWEKESFIQAVEMGAINGLLTGPLELLTFGLGKMFGRIFGRGLSKDLQADLKALAGSEFKKLSENELKSLSGSELREVVALLRKNETNLTIKEAIAQVKQNVAKDLGKSAAKAGEKKVQNNALKELADGVRKDVVREGGESAFKGAGKDAVENVAQKLSKVEKLTQQMGDAFEQHLVKQGVDAELANAAGRLVGSRLASEGARHAIDLGAFTKLTTTLVEASGKLESGTLRTELRGVTQQIGQLQNELKHLSGSSLDSGMRDLGFLRAEQQHLTETVQAARDLAGRAVGLMDGLHPQTAGQFLYKLGEGVGNYLKGGVQNVVSEGAYNLTFGENHEFTVSVESFYGGVAMGALGHLGHIAGGPLRLKLADLHLPNYARFPLAVVSTLMGHPTSLWTSHPGAPASAGGPPKGIFVGDEPHVNGPLDGSRPENLKTDSDGSSQPSRESAAKSPATTPTRTTGGDDAAKAPAGSSRTTDTSTPEPPKRSTTVGGPKEEPGRTPQEEHTATVPAPAHATASSTDVPRPAHVPTDTSSTDVPPPAHVPTTGRHEEQPQQQHVDGGDRTVHEPRRPDPRPTEPQPQPDLRPEPKPTGHQEPAGTGGTERLQYLDVGDDSHIPPTVGHFLPRTGPERQPGWVAGDAEPSPHLLETLEKLPVDPARYTVVIHTDGSGEPMPAGELASVIRGLADLGHLSGGRRTIEFVACNLDSGPNPGYVRQVMEQVWSNPKLADLKAVAADGPVWVAPGFQGKTAVTGPGTGHVIVADKVGFNTDGRPTVVGGGEWHTYSKGPDGGEPTVTRTASQRPAEYEHQPAGDVSPMDTAVRFGTDPEPAAYHYTDAPEHIRAEADGVRAEQWRRTQRDLQDQYEAKLSEAAEELRTDPDGSGHRREDEAERLLEEALDAPGRFPEDAPADLRGAVHERARTMMYESLAARPEDRQRILGDLDGLVRVAAVREAAVRVAVQHFDRALAARNAPRITDGGTGVAHTPDHAPASVVELVRQDFRARADAEAARIYADADSLTTEANTLAGQALRRLTEHARAELLLETDRAKALAEVEARVGRAAGDWYERLSPTDREMLAAVGVTERVDLSPSSVQAIRERLHERVVADFEQAAGPRDEATGRRRGHDEVRELYARSQAENPSALPHEFAVQAVREAAINRAVAEAERAADSWAEDLARKEFAEKFGADESDVLRAKDTVLRELAGEMDRAATERVGEPAALRAALDRLVDPAALHDRLTHQAARLAVRRQATAEAQAAAREHGLTPHAADRLTEGHGDRIARAFDESFRSHEDLAGRQEHWQNTRDELVRELREHAAFEREAAPALREAARGFDGLAARHTLNEALTDHLKREYGDDFVARYRELWTLDHFDAAGWNAHQRAHEDAFGRRTTESETGRSDDQPVEAGALTVVNRPGEEQGSSSGDRAGDRPVERDDHGAADLIADALTSRNTTPEPTDLLVPAQAPPAPPVALPPTPLGPEARTEVLARANRLMGGVDGRPGLYMSSGRQVGFDEAGHNMLADVKALADRLFDLGALGAEAKGLVDQRYQKAEVSASRRRNAPGQSVQPVGHGTRLLRDDLALVGPVVDAAADLLGGPLRPFHADRLGLRIGDEVGPGAANRPEDITALATSLHGRGRLDRATYERLTETPTDAEALTRLHGETSRLVADHLAGRLDLPAPESGHRLVAAMGRPGQRMTWQVDGTGSDFQKWATNGGKVPLLTEDTTLNCWESILLTAHHAGLLSEEWIRAAYADHDAPDWHSRLRDALFPRGRVRYQEPVTENGDDRTSPVPRAGDIVVSAISEDLDHVALATGRVDDQGSPLVWSFGVASEPAGAFGADDVVLVAVDAVGLSRADFGPGPWFLENREPAASVPPPQPPTPVRTVGHSTPDPEPPVPRPGEGRRAPRFVVESSFDVRRFEHDGGPVTDLTVRIAFRDGGHDSAGVWNKLVQGVEEYLNKPGYTLSNGDRMHVTVLPAEQGQKAHLTVDLIGRGRPMDQKSWWPDAAPIDYAHEVGHQLGLRDEYRAPGLTHRPDVKGSLLGNHHAPAPDGLSQGGLRERHLSLISRIVGEVERPPTSGPKDLTWQQARDAAAPQERSHVWVDPVSLPRATDAAAVSPQVLDSRLQLDQRRLIKQPGYASGDQFALVVALRQDRNLHVMIARGPEPGEPGHDSKDKSREIEALYRDSGVLPEQIHIVRVPNMITRDLYPVLEAHAYQLVTEEWNFQPHHVDEVVRNITHGTHRVAESFSVEARDDLRTAWGMDTAHDGEIVRWLDHRQIRLPEPGTGGRVLVLWSRFTGKKSQWADVQGRMEHDTSFQGTRQLLRSLGHDFATVIITGDPHPTRSGKWDELVEQMRTELPNTALHQVTGFWNERGEHTGWMGANRAAQLRLYDYLNRNYDLEHLGARSGNLEAAALIGHRVTYLEEEGASGSVRMENWHALYPRTPGSSNRLGGLAPGYERALIPDPPTASGRYSIPFDQKRPQFEGMKVDRYASPGRNAWSRKPADVYAEERGFDFTALESIRGSLGLWSHDTAEAREWHAYYRVAHLTGRYAKLRAWVTSFHGAEAERHAAELQPYRSEAEGLLGELDGLFHAEGAGSHQEQYDHLVEHALPRLPDLWRLARDQANTWAVAEEGYRIVDVERDGDCLYHAVGRALNLPDDPRQLRQRVTGWVDANQELVRSFAGPFGSTLGDLRWTVRTPGAWAGAAGDLVPRVVASALGVRLRIFDGYQWHNLDPLDGHVPAGGPETMPVVELFLGENHYSVMERITAEPEGTGDHSAMDLDRKRGHESGSDDERPDARRVKSAPPTGQDGLVVAAHPPVGLGGGEMPVPGPLHERVQALEHLSSEERRLLAEDGAFLESLRELAPEDYAQAAARLLVDVDPRTQQPVAARRTAEELVARMLADKEVAERLVASGVRIGVVPRDVPITEMPGFTASEHGTADGRDWSLVRGSSGDGLVLITEENLLGARTTIGPHLEHAEGYSVSAHELAHAIHEYGLTDGQKELIGKAYRERSVSDALAELFGEQPLTAWPDGDVAGNYSARDEHEFFAQLVTAYFGHNHGNDPATGQARNNGAAWVREHAPELVPLLEHLFGADPRADRPEPANQIGRTEAEEELFGGFREFMESVTENVVTEHVVTENVVTEHVVTEPVVTEHDTVPVHLVDEIQQILNPTAPVHPPVAEQPPLVVAPATVVTQPAPPPVPAPPARFGDRGLAAYDVLVHLESPRPADFDALVGRFTEALHGDREAARTLARSLLGGETLRSAVSALSRGDVREVSFQAGRWSGEVRITAEVGRGRHLKALNSFEFEYGSEQQSTVGTVADRLKQANLGAQFKAKFGSSGDVTATFGYQRGWMDGTTTTDASRTLARGKTTEAAELFETPFTLRVEFLDARLEGAPGTWRAPEPIDFPLTGHVAVPKRETADAEQAVEAHFAVPVEVSRHRRLAGSHIVTDVWPLDPPRRTPQVDEQGQVPLQDLNARTNARAMEKFVAAFEGAAERYFGGRWPELRNRLLSELDLGTLHQELKGTMSGQKLTIVDESLTGAAAVITIGGGAVARMRQVHTLPSTEFNIATATTRSHVEQTTTSSERQVLPSMAGNGTAKDGGGGAGLGVKTGGDGVGLQGSGSDLGNGTKTKRPAVLFEGTADLTVTFGWRGGSSATADREAHVQLGFRTVIDQDEAVLVTAADQTVAGTRPPEFVAEGPLAPPTGPVQLPQGPLRAPTDEVWSGLPDTTVVRDLRDVAPLHAELDRVGAVLLGAKTWRQVREDVLQSHSHAAVSAHLVGMSRGSALRGPEVTAGPLKDLHLATTVRLRRMTHLRGQAGAELNPIRENSTFDSSRHLRSDTVNGQLQGAGKGVLHTDENLLTSSGKPFDYTLQGGVTPSVESRVRDGWRGGESGKSYANGKYGSPQELFRAEFEVLLKVNGRDYGPVPLVAELSLEQAHTLPRELDGNRLRSFTAPEVLPVPEGQQHLTHQGDGRTPPLRLGQSDVVLSLGRGDTAVLRTVLDALREHTGRPVPANVEALLARSIDADGLKSALSGLSRGGEIRVPVDVKGWKGTIVVEGDLLRPRAREDLVNGFEFESGSQQRTSTGITTDSRTRVRVRGRLTAAVPHADLAVEVSHSRDFVKGVSIDRMGGTNSRSKSTEPARLTDADAVFRITFEPSRWSDAITAPDPVTVPAVVAAPHRAAEQVPRMLPSHRFGSSDVVTAVHLNADRSGTVRQLVDALGERPVGDGRTAAAFLGKDWSGMAKKLASALDFDRLQIDLKPVMAGHPLVVEHGRSRALITAEVSALTPTGRPPVVEFNIGSGHQTSLTSADGGTNTGGGRGTAFTLSALGTTSVLPGGAVAVVGLSGTGAKGVDRLQHGSDSSASGTAVKSKVAAVAHQAAVVLKVRFEHKPFVLLHPADAIRPGGTPPPSGPARSVLGTVQRSLSRFGDRITGLGRYRRTLVEATVHADVLMETGRDQAVVPSRYGAPKEGFPPLRAAEPVTAQVLRRPPADLFTQGPRDIGVLRWVDDTSGMRDLLSVFGSSFFKGSTWSWLESVARNTHSHAQLSALFGSVARGREVPVLPDADGERRDVVAQDGGSIVTPSAGKRLFVDDADVTATVSIVQLEYQRDNTAAALSPANDAGGGGRRTRLDWSLWNVQGQAGAKAGTGGADLTGSGILGGGMRWREGPSTGASGKTVAGAKFPTPTARYTGYAEVQLTFRDGDRTLTEKGLVPIEMEVPLDRTGELASDSSRRVLFTALHPEGEAITRGSVPDAVADVLATPLDGAGNGVHWLADPAEREASADLRAALAGLPHDDPYFTVVFHGRPEDGAPTWRGGELTPEQFAGALLRLAEGGQWQGEPLRFLSCNSAVGGAGSFAGRTVQALHEQLDARRTEAALTGQPLSGNLARLTELTAYAGNGSVYLTGGSDPRAVVARNVGFTADGRPLVDGPGDWLRLRVENDEVRTTPLGQELLHEGQEPVPRTTGDDPIDPDRPGPVKLVGGPNAAPSPAQAQPAAHLQGVTKHAAPTGQLLRLVNPADPGGAAPTLGQSVSATFALYQSFRGNAAVADLAKFTALPAQISDHLRTYGTGDEALGTLERQLRVAGPGSFGFVVLGNDRVVALLHDKSGGLHWADAYRRELWVPGDGRPDGFRADTLVRATTYDSYGDALVGEVRLKERIRELVANLDTSQQGVTFAMAGLKVKSPFTEQGKTTLQDRSHIFAPVMNGSAVVRSNDGANPLKSASGDAANKWRTDMTAKVLTPVVTGYGEAGRLLREAAALCEEVDTGLGWGAVGKDELPSWGEKLDLVGRTVTAAVEAAERANAGTVASKTGSYGQKVDPKPFEEAVENAEAVRTAMANLAGASRSLMRLAGSDAAPEAVGTATGEVALTAKKVMEAVNKLGTNQRSMARLIQSVIDQSSRQSTMGHQLNDAEVILMEGVYDKLLSWGFDRKLGVHARGTLIVASSKGTCDSCKFVVESFNTHLPHVEVVVVYAKPEESKYSDNGRQLVGRDLSMGWRSVPVSIWYGYGKDRETVITLADGRKFYYLLPALAGTN